MPMGGDEVITNIYLNAPNTVAAATAAYVAAGGPLPAPTDLVALLNWITANVSSGDEFVSDFNEALGASSTVPLDLADYQEQVDWINDVNDATAQERFEALTGLSSAEFGGMGLRYDGIIGQVPGLEANVNDLVGSGPGFGIAPTIPASNVATRVGALLVAMDSNEMQTFRTNMGVTTLGGGYTGDAANDDLSALLAFLSANLPYP